MLWFVLEVVALCVSDAGAGDLALQERWKLGKPCWKGGVCKLVFTYLEKCATWC